MHNLIGNGQWPSVSSCLGHGRVTSQYLMQRQLKHEINSKIGIPMQQAPLAYSIIFTSQMRQSNVLPQFTTQSAINYIFATQI